MSRITKMALRHWKLLFAWNTALLALTAVGMTLTPKVWTSEADLILPNVTSDLDANLGKLGNFKDDGVVFSQQLNPLKNLSSIVMSDYVMRKLWASDPEKNLFTRLDNYKEMFNVTPESESTVISLSVEGSSPELATQRMQALIATFRQRLQELRTDESLQRTQFVLKDVEQAHNKLLRAQRALTVFKQSSNLVSNEDQTRELITVINNLDSERTEALALAKANQSQIKLLSSRLAMTPQAAVAATRLGEDQQYQFLRQKLSEVDASIVQQESIFTSQHPQLKILQERGEKLRRQIQQRISANGNNNKVDGTIGDNTASLMQQLVTAESNTVSMQTKAQQLEIQINRLRAQLQSLPAQQARLQELQRQYEIAEGVYQGVVAQAEQAKFSVLNAYPNVQVLDPANVDPYSASPKLRLILLGAILTAILSSAAIVLFLENRNPLLSPKDIQGKNIPVLGSIPHIKGIAMNMDQHLGGEIEFQRLASAVSLLDLENQRLMIGSAIIGEGKTTVTLGLANALITLGFRVLIVDGDFRRATISQQLGYEKQTRLDSQLMAVNVRPGLDLLPVVVAENKIAEFVARGGFEQRLSFVQSAVHYDYVLVDSAPVGLTSETALMTAVVPNVLLVACPGTSARNAFNESIEQLTRHKAQIHGLVLNAVETRSESYMEGENITQDS